MIMERNSRTLYLEMNNIIILLKDFRNYCRHDANFNNKFVFNLLNHN